MHSKKKGSRKHFLYFKRIVRPPRRAVSFLTWEKQASVLSSLSSCRWRYRVDWLNRRRRRRGLCLSSAQNYTLSQATLERSWRRLNGQTIRLSQTKVLRPAELETASDIEFETSLEESAERSEQSDEASARKESKSCIKTRQQKRRQRQTKRSEPRV